MSFWDNVKKFAQPYSDEEYDDYDDEDMDELVDEPQETAPRSRRTSPFASVQENTTSYSSSATSTTSGFSGQVLNMNSGKQEVVLFHAKTFDDAARAADELRRKKAVILNMENAKNADALIAAENARVEDAKKVAAAKITELQEQVRACIDALERVKKANIPASATVNSNVFDFDRIEGKSNATAEAVADEISASLQALVGTTDDSQPTAEPKHPTTDTTTSKFTNLQFGRNYDPTANK